MRTTEGGEGQRVEKIEPWAPPFLRWVGSKRRLIGTLLNLTPTAYDTYYEPFVGSGAMFLGLRPKAALLSDTNAALVNAYLQVREHPRRIARWLHQQSLTSERYYEIRDAYRGELNRRDAAAHFIYLNRRCYNGVYRTNRAGQFNVPVGKNTGAIPSEASLYRASVALRSAQIEANDYRKPLARAQPGDFVYLDPPYMSGDRVTTGEYGTDSDTRIDIAEIAEVARDLSSRGVQVLITHRDDHALQRLLAGWSRCCESTVVNVRGESAQRSRFDEAIYWNYDTPGPIGR